MSPRKSYTKRKWKRKHIFKVRLIVQKIIPNKIVWFFILFYQILIQTASYLLYHILFFIVLHDASCLPRFTYHRSLVDWYMEGLPKDIIFTGCHIESCFIIIGGIITDEDNRMLFGETALSERLDIDDLLKGLNLGWKKYSHSDIERFLSQITVWKLLRVL